MTVPARTRRRQQAVARLVRRAPGYHWTVHELLPRVRRNPVLTDLAWRVFVPGTSAGESASPFHGGHHLQGADVDRLPVVGIVALDLGEQELTSLIDEVAHLQQELRSFRPLVVADRPVFAAARHHGYVLEVVLGREDWEGTEQTWMAYVADRLAALVDDYQLWHLALTDDGALRPLDLMILEQLRHRLPLELDL